MNSDNVSYALSVLPFLPYSKAAVKSVLSHSASLSLGLVAFLISKTMKGDSAMTRAEMKKPEWFDYLAVHPLALPFWVWALLYSFQHVAPSGWLGIACLLVYVFLWLRLYRESLIRILEYQPTAEAKEVLPCSELAKT